MIVGFIDRKERNTLDLKVKGEQYDLQQIYNEVNERYFSGALQLRITWSSSAKNRARVRRRLGCYDQKNQLIRIHRFLDHPQFPPFLIAYVVYHEMLHHVYPPIIKKGRRQIHHSEFKLQEKRFEEYLIAKKWQKENKGYFFK